MNALAPFFAYPLCNIPLLACDAPMPFLIRPSRRFPALKLPWPTWRGGAETGTCYISSRFVRAQRLEILVFSPPSVDMIGKHWGFA